MNCPWRNLINSCRLYLCGVTEKKPVKVSVIAVCVSPTVPLGLLPIASNSHYGLFQSVSAGVVYILEGTVPCCQCNLYPHSPLHLDLYSYCAIHQVVLSVETSIIFTKQPRWLASRESSLYVLFISSWELWVRRKGETVLSCALESYRLKNKDVSLRDFAISLLYCVQFNGKCEIYQFRWKHNAM
jgi:hypothetical protein